MLTKLIVVLAAAAASLFAQGPGFGPGPRAFGSGGGRGPAAAMFAPGERLDNATFDALKSFLTLTDAQVTQLKEVLKKQAEANKPVMEQIRAKNQELAEEMRKDSPSPATVGQLMVDIKKLREQIRDASGDVSTGALAVLTPAQQTKLKELEAAQQLVPAIHQAQVLNLLARPEPAAGALMGRMGAGAAARARVVRRAGRI